MKPTLLVLAAGMGSRYGGLKQMDSLGPHGETIIDYSIYDAVNAGFGQVVYIVRDYFLQDFKTSVLEKYRDLKCPDGVPVKFDFVTQEVNKIPSGFSCKDREKPWGTAHALLMAKDVIQGPFAVINGDDYYGRDSFEVIANWLQRHEGTSGEYCLVGFFLENTLSESGTVSRGICRYSGDLMLTGISEHLNIRKDETGVILGDDSDTNQSQIKLNGQSLCSMNMWGFTTDYFSWSEGLFEVFLGSHSSDPKKEFYIPSVVNELIKTEQATCEILQTTSQWFGVTYKEDRPSVMKKLEDLVDQKVYPSPLY